MRALLNRLHTIRLLPVTMGVMLILVVSKVAVLVHGTNGPAVLARAGHVVLPPAQAAESAAPVAKPAPALPPPPAPATPVAAADPPEPGPSAAERAVLQDLRARRVALDERARTMQERDAVLAATEKRLTERVEQLTVLQKSLEALDQTRRERDEASWRSLVKTYETMRPRDAASIFNDLDEPTLIQVLDRMKEAKAAPVLAAMAPERARVATTRLAKWRTRAPEVQP